MELRGVTPTVLRVLDVPAAATLPELHELLQIGLGWTNSHLHQFVTDEASYGPESPDPIAGQRHEVGVRLTKLPTKFRYDYDFDDGWKHDVELLGPGGDRPGCVYGEETCPPEGSGGPAGYAELRERLGEQLTEINIKFHKVFDQETVDDLVVRTVGAVPESVRLVLDLMAGGVKLTPAGRLPRAFVREVQQHRPQWYWDGSMQPAHSEDDLLPLSVLHEVLPKAGLLRLRHGVLSPTKVAGDDLEVMRRIRMILSINRFNGLLLNLVTATLAAGGQWSIKQLADRVFGIVGPNWVSQGQRLTADGLEDDLYRNHQMLCALDLVEDADGRRWQAGPSANSLLPQAVALAHHWSHHPLT